MLKIFCFIAFDKKNHSGSNTSVLICNLSLLLLAVKYF